VFTAREFFLVSRSEFFRRALTGNWTEAESRTIKLPDDDPHIFGIYLNLVYTGQLVTMRKSVEECSKLDRATFYQHISKEYDDLFSIYILVEKFQDVTAKNTIIVAVIDMTRVKCEDASRAKASLRSINKVYEGTPDSSPLRRLLMDMYGAVSPTFILEHVYKHSCCADLVKDLCKMLQETRSAKRAYEGNTLVKNGAGAYMEAI
jgi:hypothetical protein